MHVLHGILHFIDKIAVSKVLEMDKCQNITPYQNERSTQDEHTCISQSTYSVTCYTHTHKTSIFINTYPYQYTHTQAHMCTHTEIHWHTKTKSHLTCTHISSEPLIQSVNKCCYNIDPQQGHLIKTQPSKHEHAYPSKGRSKVMMWILSTNQRLNLLVIL